MRDWPGHGPKQQLSNTHILLPAVLRSKRLAGLKVAESNDLGTLGLQEEEERDQWRPTDETMSRVLQTTHERKVASLSEDVAILLIRAQQERWDAAGDVFSDSKDVMLRTTEEYVDNLGEDALSASARTRTLPQSASP